MIVCDESDDCMWWLYEWGSVISNIITSLTTHFFAIK